MTDPRSTGGGTGHVSPGRLIVTFVAVLVIVLALGAVVVAALQPGVRKADCPDPSVPCGQPPVAPTLPPIAEGSPTPGATPASGRPSGAPSPAGSPRTSGVPQPRPVSSAPPLLVGDTWASRDLGFRLAYDGRVWEIQDETATRIVLAAGNGAVQVSVEGFPGSAASPQALLVDKIGTLTDVVIGLTDESDPTRQLPGTPIVGHRRGVGALMNGTVNTPQGPAANVDVVILAATDDTISLRVTLLAEDDLRDEAFSAVDSILNSIEWPADAP